MKLLKGLPGNRDENGQTLAEYGLIATLISIVVVVVLSVAATEVIDLYAWIRDHVSAVA